MNLIELPETWDIIIIGGGITGAGLLREATDMGLRALLVERDDFASKTSSYSSKLVHGGLRYLKEGRLLLTRDSVRERERLMREAPGLVNKLGFLMPVYRGAGTGRWLLKLGLTLYDAIALKRRHRFLDARSFSELVPDIRRENLEGGFQFFDAQVDDARLVLRLIEESVDDGACALNYTTAHQVLRDRRKRVCGVDVSDTETGESRSFKTPVVVNATGAWAETIHPSPQRGLHIRALRGSHLVFPANRLPVSQAVSFTHPADRRPIFLFPWEGAVIFGTTDVDHTPGLDSLPAMTSEEAAYLMEGLHWAMPSLALTQEDCISSYSGIRPVLSEGKLDASKESREHVVWDDNGLVTITGGKLTTFRLLARDAMGRAGKYLPRISRRVPAKIAKSFAPVEIPNHSIGVSENARVQRLAGRYGPKGLATLMECHGDDTWKVISGSRTLWGELPFVSADPSIRHLDDILLRRVRMGMVLRNGGADLLPRIEPLIRPVLRWSEAQWREECIRYKGVFDRLHAKVY